MNTGNRRDGQLGVFRQGEPARALALTHVITDAADYSGTELEAMSFAIRYHRWICDELSPYLGEAVVEVGAGVGDFSRLLLDAGVKRLYAFEPASNLFPRLSESLSDLPAVSVINGIFRLELVGEPVDAMVYVNVLEHIEDDLGELRAAREALKPGGHLLIFVPALSWLYSQADEELGHFRRYHKKALKRLAEEAGFAVQDVKYFDIAGIIPWYVYFRLLKRGFGKAPVSAYDRVVVPVMRRVERLLAPPVGKNLLLVAQKES